MTRQIRKLVFLVSAAFLACLFGLAYVRLASVGEVQSRYGDMVNALTVPELHITDAVTAVNFGVRGFDTLGEEFVLFMSVVGVILLMRRQEDESASDHRDQLKRRTVATVTDVLRITALLLLGPTVLFGIYIVTHGQVSPGGGFQGGVVLATAPVLLYLCSDYEQLRHVTPPPLVGFLEALGAAAYILIGVAGVTAGGFYLENFLSPGKSGSITGGGMVPLLNAAVGLEVSGGLTLALRAYFEELLEAKES